VVVELEDGDRRRGTVTVEDPAIEARVTGSTDLPLGEDVTVSLVSADPAERTVRFAVS
jgi:hypothetical protein